MIPFPGFFSTESVALTVFLYSLVIALGVALGKIRIAGISLGITFVLFTGIAITQFGFPLNHSVVEFVREFGLILFVFGIGLQVGPGFFSSFKKGGISLNVLAIFIVLLGAAVTLSIHYLSGESLPVLVGVMSGAVTNTPGLGAAQQALLQVTGGNPKADIGLGYAVAYPFGVLGIILVMTVIRKIFRIDMDQESAGFSRKSQPEEVLPVQISIRVSNPAVFGRTIPEIARQAGQAFVISRIFHHGELSAATSETVLQADDVILLVTRKGNVPAIVSQIGTLSDMDLAGDKGRLVSRQILVTNRDVFGKKLGLLRLRSRYGINITRIYRSGIELVASPELELHMGDKLTVVGNEEAIGRVAVRLGNSLKRLNEPNIVPIFTGILLGVVLGSIPIMIPGIPNPLKLGLAGGPLVVAILLSKYGYRFSLTSYTTPSANLMLREIGIVLFLASVGMKSGEQFIPCILSGDGFVWMGYGAAITLIPLLAFGLYALKVRKRNFIEVCGLLSGSMTDPPALAFANDLAQSEAPAVAYATVYPLVMFLRIFTAQLMILVFV